MASGELKGVELFVFKDNFVFDIVLYKGTSKIPCCFVLVIRLHQVQMRRELILHAICISGNRIIEAGIDGLSRGNNLGGTIRGLKHL